MFGSSFFACLGIKLSLQKNLPNFNLQPGEGEHKSGANYELVVPGAGSAIPSLKIGLPPSKGASSARLVVGIKFTFI